MHDVLARYSNFGSGIDLLAPGGALDQDINDDGHPDGLLAMTHDPRDPTKFGYWFQVGTSPAAALVAGVAALLLASGISPERTIEVLRDGTRIKEDPTNLGLHVARLDAAAAMVQALGPEKPAHDPAISTVLRRTHAASTDTIPIGPHR